MSWDRFTAWLLDQPGFVQDAVIMGPAFIVMMSVGLFLGVRFRFLLFSWVASPALAPGLMHIFLSRRDEAAAEWADDARDAVDALAAERARRQ